MLEFTSNLLKCDKKKVNYKGGPHRDLNGRVPTGNYSHTKAQNATQDDLCCEGKPLDQQIYQDSLRAPLQNHKLLVWKWDEGNDYFHYNECNPDYKISEGMNFWMNKIFEDIKKVENYEHARLARWYHKTKMCWSLIFCIPLLVYTCCCAMRYWEIKFKKMLIKRKQDIEKKLKEFEKEKLHNENPNLRLNISEWSGYITLEQVDPNGEVKKQNSNAAQELYEKEYMPSKRNSVHVINEVPSRTSLKEMQIKKSEKTTPKKSGNFILNNIDMEQEQNGEPGERKPTEETPLEIIDNTNLVENKD